MIPTTIHQIWWQGYSNLSPEFKRNRDIFIKNHPNFKFILWDEKLIDKLIKEEYKYIFDEIENLNLELIQKIDLVKYLILYKYGGVYTDIDIISVKNIIDLFTTENKIIFFKMNIGVNWTEKIVLKLFNLDNSFIVNNGFIISPPKNIFWINLIYCCIDSCKKSTILNKSKLFKIFNTTGPAIISREIQKNMSEYIIHDYTVSEPCFPLLECVPHENTYLIHKHNLSWLIGDISENNNIIKTFYRCIFIIYGRVREKINVLTFLFFFITIPLAMLLLGPRK